MFDLTGLQAFFANIVAGITALIQAILDVFGGFLG